VKIKIGAGWYGWRAVQQIRAVSAGVPTPPSTADAPASFVPEVERALRARARHVTKRVEPGTRRRPRRTFDA
jgi:hypothetical protein